jgi:8-oxo-dGTP pyrophosphatase MutT (NUDIX family)
VETASPIIYPQSGVLAFRRVSREPEILLITTRKGHWTIPKGLVEPELGAAASAANEAFEEAGVRGRLAPESIGGFEYPKWGGVCRVAVFLLEATELADRWPEDGFRRRRWLQLPEAAAAVKFPLLANLIRRAEAIIRAFPAAGEAVPLP